MIYVVYEFNSRSEKLRFVTCSSFHSIVYDEVQKLNKNCKKKYLNYYITPLAKSEFENVLNKHLLNCCNVVAQCLHLADVYANNKGRNCLERSHSFFELAKEHCKNGAKFL